MEKKNNEPEFETALKELKNNIAPGIDNIQAEILKNSGEKALTDFLN